MRKLTTEEYLVLLEAQKILFDLNFERCHEIEEADYETDAKCSTTDKAYHYIDEAMKLFKEA